jgi:hypothetical protein
MRKTVALPERLWDEIDEYRHAQRIRTEREAIERLLQLGLATGSRGKPVSAAARRRKAPVSD